MKEKITKWISFISLGLAIAVAVGYAVLEALGIDGQWLFSILMGLLATYFLTNGIIEESAIRKNENIDKKLNELLTRFENPMTYTLEQISTQKIVLEDINDIDAYLIERIAKARMSVCDLGWWDYSGEIQVHRANVRQQNLGDRMNESIKNFCKKKNVEYKEIFTLHSTSNNNKLLQHIEFGDNFKCRYYDNLNSEHRFPKLQFVIIDDEEVIFASRYYRKHCIINDKDIVNILLNYFDQAWDLSIKVKDDNWIDTDFVNNVKESLNHN